MTNENWSRMLQHNKEAGEKAIREFWAAMLADMKSSQHEEPDRHYDRNGYCDNPARGY